MPRAFLRSVKHASKLILPSIWIATTLQGQGTPGNLGGAILDPAGSKLPGVRVAAIRVFPVGGTDADPPMLTTLSNQQGQYSFASVTPGSYKICAQPGGVTLLDPCLWSEDPPLANVRSGATVQMDVRLEQGSWLIVHVKDPGGEISKKQQTSQTQRDKSPDPLAVKIRTTFGSLEDLEMIDADTNGRNYRVAVPRGKDIALFVNGDDLEVADGDDKPVDSNAAPATVRVGNSSTTVDFKVKQANSGK